MRTAAPWSAAAAYALFGETVDAQLIGALALVGLIFFLRR